MIVIMMCLLSTFLGAQHQVTLEKAVEPIYPPLARSAGDEGVVELKLKINPDGTESEIESITSHAATPLFVGSATDAVKQWKFRCDDCSGESFIVEVSVSFKIRPSENPCYEGSVDYEGLNATVYTSPRMADPAATITYQTHNPFRWLWKHISRRKDPRHKETIVPFLRIDYPEVAKAARIEGVVKLCVAADKDGKVREIQSSGNTILSNAAKANMERWQFTEASTDYGLGPMYVRYVFKLVPGAKGTQMKFDIDFWTITVIAAPSQITFTTTDEP